MMGRRAFATAQALFEGVSQTRLAGTPAVGWHGTDVDPETGSFAVVAAGSEYEELIGEIVCIERGGREVYAFVLGARAVPVDISITRRCFLALGTLGIESLRCVVEVVA